MRSPASLSCLVRRAGLAALWWSALCAPLAADEVGWHGGTPLPVARRLMAAAAIDDTIYTFGGCGSPCFAPPLHTSTFEETRVEVYAAGTWSARAPMPEVFFGGAAAAARANGKTKIYLFGGFVTGGSTLAYDPERDSWEPRAPMPTPRHGLAAVTIDNEIYVVGGSNGTNALGTVEVYNPVTNTWRSDEPMPTPRAFFGAVAVNGKLYAIGGALDCCGNSATTVVEVFDPSLATDRWTSGPSLPRALQTSAAAVANGKIYVLGGFVPGEGTIGTTFELDPAASTNDWNMKETMPVPKDQAPAVATLDGIHVIGGSTNCHCRALNDHGTYVPEPPPPPTVALRVDKTADRNSACPGESITYTITVTNEGSSAVSGALVRDIVPGSLHVTSWLCGSRLSPGSRCTADEAQEGPLLRGSADLPVGGSVVYELTGTIALDASGMLSNRVQVRLPEHATSESPDDSDTHVTTVRRDLLDIRKTKVDPSGEIGPSDVVMYDIEVTNGCASALDTTVEDDLSASGLEDPRWCRGVDCRPLIAGDLSDTVTIPARSTVLYRASGTVPCNCRAPTTAISNVALARAPGQDEVSDSDVQIVGPPSDGLAVDITGPNVLTGCTGDYTIAVSNSGPCTATDVVLEVTVPPGLSLVPLPGPSGDPVPVGNILLGDLAAGAPPVVVIVRLEVDAGLQCPLGPPLPIRATVRSGCGQPAAEDVLAVTVPCDLAVVKSDGLAQAAPGDCANYSIDVTNRGCGDVSGATVTDPFPSQLESVRWCRGAGCTPVPDGPLADTLDLSRGASETYRIAGAISPFFVGTLVNTAYVAMPAGAPDAEPANNTSTDETAVVPAPGVTALCAGMEGAVLEGDVVTFTFVLWNGGPAAQADNPGYEFVDALPAGLTLVSAAASSGTITPIGNTVNWDGAIAVGGMVTIEVKATVDVGTVGMAFCNVATVFFDADGDGINESSAPSDGCHSCCVIVVDVPLIPTLSTLAIAALALLLAALALARLRRG